MRPLQVMRGRNLDLLRPGHGQLLMFTLMPKVHRIEDYPARISPRRFSRALEAPAQHGGVFGSRRCTPLEEQP
jgi:hypothetical protein